MPSSSVCTVTVHMTYPFGSVNICSYLSDARGPNDALSVTSLCCSKLMYIVQCTLYNNQQFLNGFDYIKLSNFPLIKLQLVISNCNWHKFDNK